MRLATIIATCAGLLFVTLACAGSGQLYARPTAFQERDEMTGAVLLHVRGIRHDAEHHTVEISLLATPEDPQPWVLFDVSAHDWQYLYCHHVAANVDGQPFQIGETNHDGRVYTGYVTETIRATFTPQAIWALANGNVARLRLCGDVFTLTRQDQAAVAEFARMAWPAFSTPANSAAVPRR